MDSFDSFGAILFDEAKSFLEKAQEKKDKRIKQQFLHASLLLGMSALEAYVNSICEELVEIPEYNLDLYEKMLLSEKKVELNHGELQLGTQLQMSRLIDKIEFIFCKFNHRRVSEIDAWDSEIKSTINLRNKLVHPKESITLTEKQVEHSLLSILETVNELFKAVYHNNVPIYNYKLMATIV